MALSDPQSLTIDGDVVTLPRTGMTQNTGSFGDATGDFSLVASNSRNATRQRQMLKLTNQKVVPDPYVPATNVPTSASVHIVFDRPITGYTADEMLKLVEGFVATLDTALITELLGYEV